MEADPREQRSEPVNIPIVASKSARAAHVAAVMADELCPDVVAKKKLQPLPVGQAYVEGLPRRGCKRCWGKGTVGRDRTTGVFEPCRCLGTVSKTKWKPYLVQIDSKGWVTELPGGTAVAERASA